MRNQSVTISTHAQFARSASLILALVASAYLMSTALDSSYGWALGWILLLPLFVAIRMVSPLAALGAGALWGSSVCVFTYAAGSVPLAGTAGTFWLLSLVPGLYALFGSLLTRRVGFSPLLLGLGWVGVELALQPLGLRQGLLAATQGDGLLIQAVGYLAGYALIAFAVAYLNAALLAVLSHVCRGGAGSAVIRGTGQAVERIFPREDLVLLFHFIRPAQACAPPVPPLA